MVNQKLLDMMNLLKKDLDEDIIKVLFANWEDSDSESYPAWYLINSPILTTIEWQRLREIKKNEIRM